MVGIDIYIPEAAGRVAKEELIAYLSRQAVPTFDLSIPTYRDIISRRIRARDDTRHASSVDILRLKAPAVQDNETKQQMEAMKQEIEMLKAELEQLKNKDTEGTNDKN